MENKENILKKLENAQNREFIRNLSSEYSMIQKNLITEYLKRLFFCIIPLQFKLFSNKCIKLKEIKLDDNFNTIISKIDENYEM